MCRGTTQVLLRVLTVALFFLTQSFPVCAEDVSSKPPSTNLAQTIGLPDPFSFDGQVRSRYEFVNWFNSGAAGVNNNYSFPTVKSQFGVGYKQESFKLYAQGEFDKAMGLPDDANAGTGFNYRSNNQQELNPGQVYVRQAYAQLPNIEKSGFSLLAGRFLYSSGAEVKSTNKTLDWVKTKRVADRLIGPFDFTFGRSFDGGRVDYTNSEYGTLSTQISHPTQGGFETNGMLTITDISLITTALTHGYHLGESGQGEMQFFYYLYDDSRQAVKPDNRALSVREADTDSIIINNYGGHIMHTAKVGSGTWDALTWGVVQEGQWGEDHHFAGALVAETGYRFDEIYGEPWLRCGLNWGSGDTDETDGSHGTFFQMLPTVRSYAMTPFYNMMNTQDLFIQGIWKPVNKVTFRTDLHFLNLTESSDLLYSGGGANSRNGSFGYSGAASNGQSDVGILLDANLWFDLTDKVGLYFYYGHLFAGDLPESTFPAHKDIDYGLVELTLKL